MPRSAEEWLAARGITREPVTDGSPAPREPSAPPAEPTSEPTPEPTSEQTASPAEPTLEDAVTKAVTYALRATAATPMSEQRLRSKLEARGEPDAVIDAALARCRAEGIVDDRAFARALVEEGRGKGHAPLRLRQTLTARGIGEAVIDEVLADHADTDPEAAAYAVAIDRARRLRGVETETAYRRLVGYLARLGYTEALARKVARQAVFADREPQRAAEH